MNLICLISKEVQLSDLSTSLHFKKMLVFFARLYFTRIFVRKFCGILNKKNNIQKYMQYQIT